MGDIVGDDEGLGSGARVKVFVRFLVRCTGMIGLQYKVMVHV